MRLRPFLLITFVITASGCLNHEVFDFSPTATRPVQGKVFLDGGGWHPDLSHFLRAVSDDARAQGKSSVSLAVFAQAGYPDNTPGKIPALWHSTMKPYYTTRFHSGLQALGWQQDQIQVMTLRDQDLNDPAVAAAVGSATAIVVWGGQTVQLSRILNTAAARAAVQNIERGAHYYGLSAGSHVPFAFQQMLQRVAGWNQATLIGTPADKFQIDSGFGPGLGIGGITSNYVVVSHMYERRNVEDPTRSGVNLGGNVPLAMYLNPDVDRGFGLIAGSGAFGAAGGVPGAQIMLSGPGLRNVTVLQDGPTGKGVFLYMRTESWVNTGRSAYDQLQGLRDAVRAQQPDADAIRAAFSQPAKDILNQASEAVVGTQATSPPQFVNGVVALTTGNAGPGRPYAF